MAAIPPPEHKIFSSLSDAVAWRESMRRAGLRVALTNGCFDLLHRGHTEYLRSARNLGDALIVLLNSDESVRALKGPSRPLNDEADRGAVLAALECVDAVLVFRGSRCHREIAALRPDCYAKGGDYTVETLDPEEREALFGAGTEIVFLPFVPGHSTTNTIRKMQS